MVSMAVIVALIMFFVFGLMAIGVIFGRKPISGSCGGISKANGETNSCPICGDNPEKCDKSGN